MSDLTYKAVSHEHEKFLNQAMERDGFKQAYEELEIEYELVREMLSARAKAGLTQEAVAKRMGTTKSAVSRSEAAGQHAPSLTTLKRYAKAVGCHLEIRLVLDVSSSA